MNRIFLCDNNYCNSDRDEGVVIQNALETYCKMNFDQCASVTLDDSYKDEDSARNMIASLYDEYSTSGKRIIPVGSIEFVQKFLEHEKGEDVSMAPLEVPEALYTYLYRPYRITKGSELKDNDINPLMSFVKDADHLKKFNSLLCTTTEQVRYYINDDTNYVVSARVKFESEWRIFVYRDRAIGAECYSGNPAAFPDSATVQSMIGRYTCTRHPEAYVLDVGIRDLTRTWKKDGKGPYTITEPIEIHPFVAVGLYGFNDQHILDMWDAGYRWYLE